MSILNFITDFKYQGYILALQTVLTILKLFANDVVIFIGKAVDAGKRILEAMEAAGKTPEEIKEVKLELAMGVVKDTKAMFSASPSYIRTAFIEVVRGLWVMITDAKSDKQKSSYEKMLREHPIHSGSVENVKKSMPEELRKLLFPVE